jgi:general secretion pathway protein A
MYCSHYGFSERPFEVTPDPKFLYLSQLHREVLSTLLYGIRERRGFIVVLGDAGTGKTTLLRSAVEQLEENVKVAIIDSTDVTFEEFIHMVLIDLGLSNVSDQLGKVAALQRLNEFAIGQLSKKGNIVILVDEAQNLSPRCMENLRLLSNLETSKTKLLQIILSGQPELEEKLKRHDLRQLSQRNNLRRQLLPFNEEETYTCIRQRLNTADYKGSPLFTSGAQRLIWEYSGGIPRKINTICDNALLTGYALQRHQLDRSVLKEVIEDLTGSAICEGTSNLAKTSSHPILHREAAKYRPLKVLLPIACFILLSGIILLTWQNHRSEISPSISPELQTITPELQTITPELQTTPDARVIVKKGETLSDIIMERFGMYDDIIEQDILRTNPSIRNPDRIREGQIITFPYLTFESEK